MKNSEYKKLLNSEKKDFKNKIKKNKKLINEKLKELLNCVKNDFGCESYRKNPFVASVEKDRAFINFLSDNVVFSIDFDRLKNIIYICAYKNLEKKIQSQLEISALNVRLELDKISYIKLDQFTEAF